MTIGELIEQLQKYPMYYQVMVRGEDYYDNWSQVETVNPVDKETIISIGNKSSEP